MLMLIVGSLLLTGCASGRKKTPEEKTVIAGEKPVSEGSVPFERVGTVTLVNPRSGFVLIEGRVSDLPLDFTLKSFEPSAIPEPEGETSVLKVSIERAGRFVVADIVSGLPRKGDIVYR